MTIPAFKDFLLVGGTNLSLIFGHRMSDDLDLFSINDFENAEMIQNLENEFQDFTYKNNNNPIGVFGFIGKVKVDFVKHKFPLISEIKIREGIRLMGLPDIMAMKINAVMKRGVKKDFWDIAEILNHYPVKHFISSYEKKFPSQQLLISVPQAMVYFDDAEESEEPKSLKGQTWESVKKFIQKKVSDYLR